MRLPKKSALLDLYLIDLYECDHETLLDPEWIRARMLEAAKLMGADVRAENFNVFEPWGVSGTVTIAESHLAIHTWPEYDYAAVTFETCGENMDLGRSGRHLIEVFGSNKPKIARAKRGFIDMQTEPVVMVDEIGLVGLRPFT